MKIIWSPRGQRRLAEYAHSIAEYDYPQTAYDWLVDRKAAVEHLADSRCPGEKSQDSRMARCAKSSIEDTGYSTESARDAVKSSPCAIAAL